MSGVEVCKAIRADPGLAHVPFILTTAYGSFRKMLDGFASGVDHFLDKPFDVRDLLARIEMLLRNRALERTLAEKNEQLEQALAKLRVAAEAQIQSARLETALAMAGALAHEINNSLSVITGLCDLVTSQREDQAEESIRQILEKARHIAAVVHRIQSIREVHFVPYVQDELIVDLDPGSP
jgi:response regulator RpfG family c-di-GMP phosphodiesterase